MCFVQGFGGRGDWGISNEIPVGVVASLDKGRLLERDLIEANRADPAIHHPVAAAAAPGARSRRLAGRKIKSGHRANRSDRSAADPGGAPTLSRGRASGAPTNPSEAAEAAAMSVGKGGRWREGRERSGCEEEGRGASRSSASGEKRGRRVGVGKI